MSSTTVIDTRGRDVALRRTITHDFGAPLNVCVEGSFASLRVRVDSETVLEREVTPFERSDGRAELSVDLHALDRWTRHAQVSVECRDESVDHARASASTGPWRLVATLVVRGRRGRATVGLVVLSSLFVALYWFAAAVIAASPVRFAWDVASALIALSVGACWFGVGGARAPRVAVLWLVGALVLSWLSYSQCAAVQSVNGWGAAQTQLRTTSFARWMQSEVVVVGDVVTIEGVGVALRRSSLCGSAWMRYRQPMIAWAGTTLVVEVDGLSLLDATTTTSGQ